MHVCAASGQHRDFHDVRCAHRRSSAGRRRGSPSPAGRHGRVRARARARAWRHRRRSARANRVRAQGVRCLQRTPHARKGAGGASPGTRARREERERVREHVGARLEPDHRRVEHDFRADRVQRAERKRLCEERDGREREPDGEQRQREHGEQKQREQPGGRCGGARCESGLLSSKTVLSE
jgi:hypothetical protein